MPQPKYTINGQQAISVGNDWFRLPGNHTKFYKIQDTDQYKQTRNQLSVMRSRPGAMYKSIQEQAEMAERKTNQSTPKQSTPKQATPSRTSSSSSQRKSAQRRTSTPKSSSTKTGFALDTKAEIPNYVKPLATQQQPQVSQEDWNTYINQPIVDNNTNTTNYDTNYIRGFRGQGEQGYRDVDSYLTWLKNNKDSADYKLFMQNGYFKDSGDALDGNELDYDQIGAMLASQGIRGNLGRRDSRRLGNVLTRLRDQSTAGTEANKEFLQGVVSSYNQNKDRWVRPAEGYTGLRNATITGDGQIGFLDESGNETYFPYSKQSPTYQIDENSPEFQAIRNQFSATNPSSSFQPVSQGNWSGSTGNIFGSTYRPQWNMTSGTPYPRTAFFGTSISDQAGNMMKAWNDYTMGLLPHRGFNSGANS